MTRMVEIVFQSHFHVFYFFLRKQEKAQERAVN